MQNSPQTNSPSPFLKQVFCIAVGAMSIGMPLGYLAYEPERKVVILSVPVWGTYNLASQIEEKAPGFMEAYEAQKSEEMTRELQSKAKELKISVIPNSSVTSGPQ